MKSSIDLAGVRTWLRGVLDGTDSSGLSVDEHLEEIIGRIDATIGAELVNDYAMDPRD